MAGFNATSQSPTFEYQERPWGDLIIGTSDELQALGLGVGFEFPSDRRGRLIVRDPRGFRAEIRTDYRNGLHVAYVVFPGREELLEQKFEIFAPGVKLTYGSCSAWYSGTAEALCAAGLAKIEHFPGHPGMRKVIVTIYPDGSVSQGHLNANDPRAREVGATRIYKLSKATFRCMRVIAAEDAKRKRDEIDRRRALLEQQLGALPRPPRLTGHSNVVLLGARRALCGYGSTAANTSRTGGVVIDFGSHRPVNP